MMVRDIQRQDAQFAVSRITLRDRKLDPKQCTEQATFVPSGVAEITRLQQRGGLRVCLDVGL